MIQVSNEFKNAIKSAERRIKGYVEVLYDLPSVSITATANTTSEPTPQLKSDYFDISEIVNGKRISNHYGTTDYLPLDGTYLVMGTSGNDNGGFITNDIAGNIDAYYDKITLTFDSTTVNGITIYYENNFPETVQYTLSDGTTGFLTSEEERQYIIFNAPKTINSVVLQYGLWRYPTRKIRIVEVDLGITEVYKNQDLIEFTVDEEVNKLVEEVPVNETNVILNNMGDLFNPLNPTGIVPYLSENTLIKPYVGVLTESLGVEYVKMGEFYFDSYTNNSDSTTTLVGKNIIKQLEKEVLKNDNETNFFKLAFTEQDFLNYMENYNYIINQTNWNKNLPIIMLRNNRLLDVLKEMTFGQWNIMYADRNNGLNFVGINNAIRDTLSKNELINDVDYKKIDKINTVRLSVEKVGTSITVSDREVLSSTVTLNKSPEIFLIQNTSPQLYFATLTQSGGTSATIVSQGHYMMFVKVTGTVGSDVTLKFNSSHDFNPYIDRKELTNNVKPEIVLEFDSFMNYFTKPYIENSNILNITPSYEMSFEYNGDPSLEAGDYINVETPYGYKPLFIQKNRIKFDGGLSGSIEGVE